MRQLTWILFGAICLIAALFLHYTLPRVNVVRIVNVEVQRIDTSGSWFYAESETASVDGTRDIKIIQTVRKNDSPRVYRNEDTGWGWPPYFKFNSSDLQARAADFASNGQTQVWSRIKSYGWRSQLLSIYPNVLSVRAAEGPDDKPFPVGNILILLVIGGVLASIYRLLARFWDKRIDPVIDGISDVFDGDDDDEVAPPPKKSFFSRFTGR